MVILQRRQWQPTPVLLPGKSHGQRSLVGYNPWGPKSRTRLSDFTFTFYFHALEKEMGTHSRGAWWAAVYGVAQSQTRLKWLSSSCSKVILTFWFGLVAQWCPTLDTPWTVAHKAPLFMGFSRKEYLSGLQFPSPGDHPAPGIESWFPTMQVDSLPTELPGKRNCQTSFYNGFQQYHLHFSV